MKVRRLSIRNVKSIQQLDIAFEERVTLLHGANGIGKSTILDCLALLGHVTSMRQAIVGNGTGWGGNGSLKGDLSEVQGRKAGRSPGEIGFSRGGGIRK